MRGRKEEIMWRESRVEEKGETVMRREEKRREEKRREEGRE